MVRREHSSRGRGSGIGQANGRYSEYAHIRKVAVLPVFCARYCCSPVKRNPPNHCQRHGRTEAAKSSRRRPPGSSWPHKQSPCTVRPSQSPVTGGSSPSSSILVSAAADRIAASWSSRPGRARGREQKTKGAAVACPSVHGARVTRRGPFASPPVPDAGAEEPGAQAAAAAAAICTAGCVCVHAPALASRNGYNSSS